ncbi:lysoplasmalogenase [Tenacibaculum agarivorans]|uniref:lysoplasmalogenase n=1 Tax=Tenacibaculum agarivorans TaxID=1908389 RepID=UPI00094B85DF|nr:lysoplasmalogenase [Tenacibaculum agarivorans]
MIITVFSIVISISAILAIYFRQQNSPLFNVFKPLTTILIIILSLYVNTGAIYGWIVSIGLFFSLLGDILLLKKEWFVYGLGAFLLAHIIFTYAFTSLFGFQYKEIIILVMLLSMGIVYYRFLYPSLKELAIPVALYFLAIIIMNWQAISLSFVENRLVFYMLGFGSVLFTFSDAIIAYDKFIKEFKTAEILILSTYWISIFIICMSIQYILV